MKMHIEVTDTFGGEANYAWVKRKTVEMPEGITRRSVVQRAKKEMGWTGERCTMRDYSEAIELWLTGAHIVMFITFES